MKCASTDRSFQLAALLLTFALLAPSLSANNPSEDEAAVRAALRRGDMKTAVDLANAALERSPNNSRLLLLRGSCREQLDQLKEALADFDNALTLDPEFVNGHDYRGNVRLKLGDVNGAVADFNKFLAAFPQERARYWQRGIACYYAGQFDEGRKQFEAYQTYADNDVENAVWHFLCVARMSGMEKARAGLVKIRPDSRIPMMEVYALFAGKAEPKDVLAAANAGSPSAAELQNRLFYAHLYLGLYFDAAGDKAKAQEHITLAADKYPSKHYMGYIARVHCDLLKK